MPKNDFHRNVGSSHGPISERNLLLKIIEYSGQEIGAKHDRLEENKKTQNISWS